MLKAQGLIELNRGPLGFPHVQIDHADAGLPRRILCRQHDHARQAVASGPGRHKMGGDLGRGGLGFIVPGRPHQLRVAAASLGCPLLGDLKYGARAALHEGRVLQALGMTRDARTVANRAAELVRGPMDAAAVDAALAETDRLLDHAADMLSDEGDERALALVDRARDHQVRARAELHEGDPSGALADAITETFGSVDDLKAAVNDAGVKRFGSGWTWLVWDGTGLAVMSTPNQDSPIMEGKTPILGIDVWEHAYYLNYQNRRPDYIDAFWNVVNWSRVAEQLEKAGG